jgi:hypothetical protein
MVGKQRVTTMQEESNTTTMQEESKMTTEVKFK